MFLCAAGGTGGHLYPALAVALELRARGQQVLFTGEAGGMEATVVPAYGFDFEPLPRFSLGWRDLASGRWWRGRSAAGRLLERSRPHAVLLAGGRTAVLLGWAAAPLVPIGRHPGSPRPGRPPVLLLEQNAVPGRANRWLAGLPGVVGVACTFEESLPWFPPGSPCRVTGCPVRPQVLAADRQQGVRALDLDPKRRNVVVLGGSRGAPVLHRAVLQALPFWQEDPWFSSQAQVIHIGGWVNQPDLGGRQLPDWYHYVPYLESIGDALAAADLVVARAGASGLAEIAARGLAALLVPWPQAADRHQEANARALQERAAVVVLPEVDCTGQRLATDVSRLLQDSVGRRAMAAAITCWGRVDAAAQVADWLQQLARVDAKES